MAANVLFKRMSAADYAALASKDNGTFYRVIGEGNAEDLYLGAKKLNNAADITAALDALDVEIITSGTAGAGQVLATITTPTGDFVALSGVTEVNGVLTAASAVNIKKVAATGAAADLSIADAEGNFDATNVEGALAELAAATAGGVESKTVYLNDASAGQSTYAKVYNLYQGSDSADMSNNTLVGTINIPKDLVVQSGSVVTVTSGQDSEGDSTSVADGKYIKLVIQNQAAPLYINVVDLVDVYTGGTTAEATVSVSAGNVITVTIGEISGTKLSAGSVAKAKLDSAVQDSLDLADSSVQSVAEGATNGTIAVDGSDVAVHGLGSAAYTNSSAYDAAGLAAAAETAANGYTDTAVSGALTNAQAYTDAALTWEED